MTRKPWSAAPIWRGYLAVIVGGGASFSAKDARLIAMARAAEKIRVIAINDAVYPCWFSDICYAADWTWWHYHGQLPGYAGLKLSIEQRPGDPSLLPEWLDYLRNTGPDGFDPEPDALRGGGHSGYQALHLAVHLGAARAMLVGFDVQGAHWFGEHPKQVRKYPLETHTRVERFKALSEILSKRKFPVVTCTPDTPLTMFKYAPLHKALGDLDGQGNH